MFVMLPRHCRNWNDHWLQLEHLPSTLCYLNVANSLSYYESDSYQSSKGFLKVMNKT